MAKTVAQTASKLADLAIAISGPARAIDGSTFAETVTVVLSLGSSTVTNRGWRAIEVGWCDGFRNRGGPTARRQIRSGVDPFCDGDVLATLSGSPAGGGEMLLASGIRQTSRAARRCTTL
jgi:hypothetical protein